MTPTASLPLELVWLSKFLGPGSNFSRAQKKFEADVDLDPSSSSPFQNGYVQEGDHLHLYLTVTDLEATLGELADKAEFVYSITTKPWGVREFTIRDPDGHTVYFAEAGPEPES